MLRTPPPPRKRDRKAARMPAASAVGAPDQGLFEALRGKRLQLAREQGVPPYVIFHDKTLIELATRRPATQADMAGVPGVGKAKLDQYGAAFLAVIAGEG